MSGGVSLIEEDCSEFAEVDPTGRYGRYDEILGKGASKAVYRAFDEYEGIEVAWNQVKLHDFMRNPEDLEKLYREIHLLKTLKHESIMKFYTSWVDTTNLSINFVTELFTSGTLRQYRMKHRRVNIRAVKQWCRQILEGLLYLHSHSPPIIHRDLKCDNIFINGNQGKVKIGDLGLAAILRKSHAAHCVGTPEFMAPEVYEEEYNELVDIYSFGMCILEMVTFEYPYSECTHPAQIYKKVTSGKKPEAFYKVKDPEVRQFVEKCLATVTHRLTAFELLQDPFLQIVDDSFDMRPADYYNGYDEAGLFLWQPQKESSSNSLNNGFADYLCTENQDGGFHYQGHQLVSQISGINLFTGQDDDDDEHLEDADISIKGKRKDDDGVFLRLRIADTEGRIRNIYFPFDTETDTAWSVAAEMVSELDITNQDVAKIADMIDAEIAALVPEWKMKKNVQESPQICNSSGFCQACASNGYMEKTVSSNSQAAEKSRLLECSKHGNGASVHGRFEEITYQVEGQEQCVKEDVCKVKSEGARIHYADIWGQRDKNTQSDADEETGGGNVAVNPSKVAKCSTKCPLENDIRQELRWLKARYSHHLTCLKDQTFDFEVPIDANSSAYVSSSGKSFRTGNLVPPPLHRATSLPVDSVGI